MCYDYYCRPVFIIPFETVLAFPASKTIDRNISPIFSFLVMGSIQHFLKHVIFERAFPEMWTIKSTIYTTFLKHVIFERTFPEMWTIKSTNEII